MGEPENHKGIDIRASPDTDGERTEHELNEGDVFHVSETIQGEDGVTYLKLADDRGWLFDKKPGVGVMCVQVEAAASSMLVNGVAEQHVLAIQEVRGQPVPACCICRALQ